MVTYKEERVKRNKEETKDRIMGAVGKLLAEGGFRRLGVNAVAREAGVDKVLIYRYFGGMPELLGAFGVSGDFWPTFDDLTGGDVEGLRAKPLAQATAIVLRNFARALRDRPLTCEILAWETVERNELTEVLEKVREDSATRLLEELAPGPEESSVDLAAITALFGAAIMYLVVRSRHVEVFNAVDIGSEDGWRRLEAAITTVCEAVLKGEMA
jgi:AcrR family transcriptional regulator